MIEIRQLIKDYGPCRAVDDLTLDVPQGQVLGLLGPNGAGKTTTLRILTGYLPASSGTVRVDGFDSLTESRSVRSRLGYLPESNPLYPEMRVEEYLHFRGKLFGMDRATVRKAVDRVVDRCRLDEMRRRLIGRLSKGYRQRVGLAAALLHQPPVLVLDEPTSGLDPMQIRETRRLIRDLAGEHTMILSSHILPEIEVTCDRVVIIARGQVRADGTISELQNRAGDEARYRLEVKSSGDGDHSQKSEPGVEDSFATRLRSMKGVTSVERLTMDQWVRYDVTASGSVGDLREPLGGMVQGDGLLCRELSRESASLEQLFIRVTSDVATEDRHTTPKEVQS